MTHLFRPIASLGAILAMCAPVWAAADPQLLALLPPDATVIAGIDVAETKASPFGQFLLTRFGQQAKLDELNSLTGFDPRTDLIQVLAASSGDKKSAVVVARGAFEPAKIQALGKPSGVHRGFALTGGDNSGPVAAFLDGSTAVAGNLEEVKAAIDRWVDGATASGELTAEAQRVSGAAHAWVAAEDIASLAPKPAEGQEQQEPQTQAIQGLLAVIETVSGGVTFGAQDLVFAGQADARSAQDAQALADVLKLLVGLAPPELPVAGATFAAEGETVRGSFAVPEASAEQIAERHLGQ